MTPGSSHDETAEIRDTGLYDQEQEPNEETARPENLHEEADERVKEDDDHPKRLYGRMSSSKGAKSEGGHE